MDPQRPATRSAADLSRLRIDRGPAGAGGRVRGWNPLWFVLLLALAGGAWLFRDTLLAKVGQATAGGTQVRTARSRKVVPGEVKATDVPAAAYVIANRTASLASVISGRLVELNAQEGQIVEANSVVARVQYDDLEAQQAEAAARTVAAEAAVMQAKKAIEAARMDVPRLEAEGATLSKLVAEARENAERLSREVERNRALVPAVVSADVFDRLEGQARAAQRALEAAEARVAANTAALAAWSGEIARREADLATAASHVEIAKRVEATAVIQVEKTRIRAPFRGLVIRKDAEKGEVIAPTGGGQNSKGSVLTIVDPESFEMQVELNERLLAKVAEGDETRIKLDAEPDTFHPGVVRKIWPRADRSKGTVEVRVAFLKVPPQARPDMAGRVVFQGKAKAPEAGPGGEKPADASLGPAYVVVPPEAVTRRDGVDVVFLVENGTARRVKVSLGAPKDGQAVVAEGLQGGETVVLTPSAALVDGERVVAAP